ncbi:MAG: glycoside hydrolase/phage tail family protein [Neorhizobium sp.]|nr:glycoside hydrolase/phage tail family protein [Neorhizobium sp.]
MATLLLQAAGSALGSVFGPVGAIVGRAAGALAGNIVDHALLSGNRTVTGARLATARIPGADDGTAITRLYGTMRIGGTLIWATRFEEETTSERSGGKAGGTRVESFLYHANIAIGLCEGPVAAIRRVWADGQEIDLRGLDIRFYRGTEDQLPDPLIEAKQGQGNAPAYRGLAYIVFERLALDPYGNRIPVFQFEVLRPVGRLEGDIRAVTIIPGATEWGYATAQVTEKTGEGSASILNRHTLSAETDWQASLDELQGLCPNLCNAALVVSWFGTDLRAGDCRILPGVEVAARKDESAAWSVAGMGRQDARLVSRTADGKGPAYGGTPADASVAQAIADLKARGIGVFLYPFVMMDIPPANGLPDPYGGAEQAAFPWRGRITCHPAPLQPGTTDGSAAARAAVDAFMSGPEGYRRLVLHYAALAAGAGGVDGFILGSELRGLTTLRDETGAFPFVAHLVELAADVRAILGPETKLTYAADWSEYFGHHPADGSGDVFFHLDPLWASPDIDAVGIDNYMPLSDWRDEDLSATNPDGFRLADDSAAMRRMITAGEGFDWYYASNEDRIARNRSTITDGLAAKPWTFRHKDIEGWWANRHHERTGGVERADPTAWTPRMKPVWFTELGCPAVDKGANQPNVFIDPKSAESSRPYFSSGARADSQQRRFLEAHHGWWQGGAAPVGMVDPDHLFVWTWDARPQPAFPDDLTVWSDGGNWRTGHWLTGRMGAATLADTIASILTDHGFADFDLSEVSGDLTGYVQAEVSSARALIEPLLDVFQIDAVEDAGTLRFRSRRSASLAPIEIATVADVDDAPLWQALRGHDSDLPVQVELSAADPAIDYEQASNRSRRLETESRRILSHALPAALSQETALAAAEMLLRGRRLTQKTLSFSLSPAEIAVEPGDVVTLALPDAASPEGAFVVSRVEDGAVRRVEAEFHAPLLSVDMPPAPVQRNAGGTASEAFAPLVQYLDLPVYAAGNAEDFARVAAYCRPFRRIAVSSSVTTENYRMRVMLDRPARIGRLVSALGPGVSGRFDGAAVIDLTLPFLGLASADRLAVLAGDSRLAVETAAGWEIVGFASALEVEPGRWHLTDLLRGLAGTEDAMAAGAAAGAAVVVLDDAVKPLGLGTDERGLAFNWLIEAQGAAGGRTGPHVFSGGVRALTPVAPVHLRAVRQDDGAVLITWVRRARIGADDWAAAEIPLDEPDERYRIDILADRQAPKTGQTHRSADVAQPAFLYREADELADFGARQQRLSVRIRQMGRAIPLGIAAEMTLDIR